MDIELQQEDITQLKVGGIVNAANSLLIGGGGIDGAINRAGGPQILEEYKIIRNKQGECPSGEAVITNAGKLPCHKVIHTVGPKCQDGNHHEKELLENCYNNSLAIAKKHQLKTLAFLNTSTGVFSFSEERSGRDRHKSRAKLSSRNSSKSDFLLF